jgi:ferredoxin-NADP reductase
VSDAVASAFETTRDLLVRQVRLEAEGVVSLQLTDPHGNELPAWEPGAHLDVILPSGLVRQYSLCGDVEDLSAYTVAVLREEASRGGSKEVHETALVGRLLGVRGPRNQFRLVEAEDYLFLAGGIGITPILPMVAAVREQGRPFRLVYGGRTRASMAFLDHPALSDPSSCTFLFEDEHGRPDIDGLVAGASPGTAVYCCGPPGMIAAAEASCGRLLARGALHVERFSAPPSLEDLDRPLPASERAFEVELARTGKVLEVPPDRSLLRVVLDAVPSHLYSCEEGYCGTCEARVVAGEPDHRDSVLSDEERAEGKMILCVGRSRSPRLVLDL